MDITRLSSKGQIVIPKDLREGFETGERLLVIRKGEDLLIKRASTVPERFLDDLEFAVRTEKALREYERHPRKSLSPEKFLRELDTW